MTPNRGEVMYSSDPLIRRPEYLKFYLDLQLGLKQTGKDNCEEVIAATKGEGVQQKLGSLIHFYRHYDLIGKHTSQYKRSY